MITTMFFIFAVYVICVVTNAMKSDRYHNSIYTCFNNSTITGPTTINKCDDCGLLFSEYTLHTVHRKTCGCPDCGSSNWSSVGAEPRCIGSPFTLNCRKFWKEIKR